MALADNLAAYWKLDESSGNASDSVNSNTATNNNSVTYTSGLINNGATFGATNKNLSAADSVSLSVTGDLSVSFWVNLTSIPAQDVRIPLINKEGSYGIAINRNKTADGHLSYFVGVINVTNSSTAANEFQSTKPAGDIISANAWHHIVFTFNHTSGVGIFYIDGSSNNSTTSTAVSITDNANALVMGGNAFTYTNGGYFTLSDMSGMLDEVGIWSRVLSSAEVTSLYKSGAGWQYPFVNVYTLVAALGSYALTGEAATFLKAHNYSVALTNGAYALTGFPLTISPPLWTRPTKNAASWTPQTPHAASWTNGSKNSTSFTNQSK